MHAYRKESRSSKAFVISGFRGESTQESSNWANFFTLHSPRGSLCQSNTISNKRASRVWKIKKAYEQFSPWKTYLSLIIGVQVIRKL